MISETVVYSCRRCGSENIVKNGTNACGNQQYWCKDCNAHLVLNPTVRYTQERKDEIIAAYKERPSMRGISRIFGVSRDTLADWLKKSSELPALTDTIQPFQDGDVLELDEAWSFVYRKTNKRWLWTALCRRTRKIIAFVIGDHSYETCVKLWNNIPNDYKQCHTFSDFWHAYELVFPEETHRSVGKETGETAHMERWYNTLRQRCARYVRRTLSFSKSEQWHCEVTNWFIVDYNLSLNC
ncbi:MAG: IS1 family transposase [Planctomycetes bacterium]|nr:IS1 family transposase [Planctomycetota bacterium]